MSQWMVFDRLIIALTARPINEMCLAERAPTDVPGQLVGQLSGSVAGHVVRRVARAGRSGLGGVTDRRLQLRRCGGQPDVLASRRAAGRGHLV